MSGILQIFKKRSDNDITRSVIQIDDDNLENKKEAIEGENDDHSDEVSVDQLPGVQKVEAVTLVWSKKAVYLTYAGFGSASSC